MLHMLRGRPDDRINLGSDDTEIDITPMLDVVFIMLIFFIVSASFVRESGLGISKADGDSKGDQLPIVLDIGADNQVKIQNRIVLPTAIRSTVIRLKSELPDAPVVVTLHPKARTRAVVAALDKLKSANVTLPNISLKTS